MMNMDDLRAKLHQIDRAGYKAYKGIKGRYAYPDFTLVIDHVQGDPFAIPSRFRVIVSDTAAGYPRHTYSNRSRAVALSNYLTGEFAREARRVSTPRGSGKSGLITINAPGQELLQRTSVIIDGGEVEARFRVGLPASGRRILGREAACMLCDDIPAIVRQTLFYEKNDQQRIEQYVTANEDADYLRGKLEQLGLVAFLACGCVLPRRSGIDDRPLETGTIVPLQSPESLQVSIDLPNAGPTVGLGIPRGVTLIVGGGFHGKSTILNALERGVYNHRPDDGRELVVTLPGAVKIRAEDGR
ncbi:MAG: ABC-ATPase domain-containing protein, partial [Planctomycetota bacterium]|nr:ABC-ATPase domain-containing protein [Planctomycetota bacterium]